MRDANGCLSRIPRHPRDRGSREIISRRGAILLRKKLTRQVSSRGISGETTPQRGKGRGCLIVLYRAIHINPPRHARKRFSVFAVFILVAGDTTTGRFIRHLSRRETCRMNLPNDRPHVINFITILSVPLVPSVIKLDRDNSEH